MKREDTILERLEKLPETPAFRQVRKLAHSDAVSIDISNPPKYRAEDALSIWQVRLHNALSRKRRLTGLSSLVRALNQLPQDAPIQQAALTKGLTTALVFFRADTHEPIGAVISAKTEADVARSHANYERAMGLHVADDIAA